MPRWVPVVAIAVLAAGAAGTYIARSAIWVQTSYAAPATVPIGSGDGPTRGASPASLPVAVSLPVPFTPQAPLGNWAAKQHTCEEASMVMVDRYLHGDHSGSLIDPQTADAAINQITAWKPAQDLTSLQIGQVAQKYMGWAYKILPSERLNMKQQLALGRPLIFGVRTHGLGNPNYPGYRDHYENPAYSVSHYLVVVGYDQSDTYILNDPGLTRGHGYHITYDQLMHAVDDLDQAYPDLNMGRIILVLAPESGAPPKHHPAGLA